MNSDSSFISLPGAALKGGYDFDIVSRWKFDAKPEELTAIVLAPELLHRWCPTVFMHSELLDRGQPDGLGMSLRLHTKGFLPHSFFFMARIVTVVPGRFLRIAVSGDFDGVGEITITPDDSGNCHAQLHWRTSVLHPWLRPFIRLFHRVFVWNHRWSTRNMARLLQAEIERRRTASRRFTKAQATFPHNLAAYRAWQRCRVAPRRWS